MVGSVVGPARCGDRWPAEQAFTAEIQTFIVARGRSWCCRTPAAWCWRWWRTRASWLGCSSWRRSLVGPRALAPPAGRRLPPRGGGRPAAQTAEAWLAELRAQRRGPRVRRPATQHGVWPLGRPRWASASRCAASCPPEAVMLCPAVSVLKQFSPTVRTSKTLGTFSCVAHL